MIKRTTRTLSLLLALAMLLGMVPALAQPAAADVSEELVAALAQAYDGDEARARENLEALQSAGILDETGNLVALDIREDGESVELSALAERIADGETVGALTVNGNPATAEQIVQIQSVKGLLEMIQIMDEDVEITDEHVANLEALLTAIADGNINLDEAISSGELRLKSSRSVRLLGSAGDSDLPTTSTGTGNVSATDGKYTAPYISDSTYNANYQFELTDPTNTTYFTDSNYDGLGLDGVVTLSCEQTTVAQGNTVTVTATLDKAQSVPVSFDWRAYGVGVDSKNTVTWAAGESGEKTFSFTIPTGAEKWDGGRALVISASNLQNALMADGTKVWNNTLKVERNDHEAISNISGVYAWVDMKNAITEFTLGWQSKTDGKVYYAPNVDLSGAKAKFKLDYNIGGSGNYKLYFQLTKDGAASGIGDGWSRIDGDSGWNISTGNFTKELTYDLHGENYVNLWMYTTRMGLTWNSLQISLFVPPQSATIQSVSVPAGTYYSGQVVPVTVNASTYIAPADTTKLTVNGVSCDLLDTDLKESKTLTFGYTVRDEDTGSIQVSALTGGLKNYAGSDITINGDFPAKSFGTDDNVALLSDVKHNSLDLDEIKYGLSDADAGEQVVTVVVPFKSGLTDAQKAWAASEGVSCATGGQGIALPVPDYPNGTATHYLAGAYFSYDGGTTRYPVYLVNSGGTEGVALASRFAPPMNETAYLRLDTLDLYMDTQVVSAKTDATKYLPAWADMKTDAKGFAYSDSSMEAAAPALVGASYSYYVKGGVFFEPDKYVNRGGAEYTVDEKGFFPLNGSYVLAQDAEHPDYQYDLEVVANQAFYDAVTSGIRAEDPSNLVLSYQYSSRKNFTFTAPKDFTWNAVDSVGENAVASDVATVIKDEETGAGRIVFTGNGGTVYFTLTVGNGSASKAYTLPAGSITVLEGKTPFLNVPEFSQTRTTLTGTDTDVLFASNVTVRNAAVGKETTFTATLYKDGFEGTKVWEESFQSTTDKTVTHITVPGGQLNEAGTYAVKLSAKYEGGEVNGVETEPQELSATAYLIVKQAPVKITLNKLDSYAVTNKNIPASLGYTLTSAADAVEVEYTIQKSGEVLGERKTASGGSIPFSADTPAALKDSYTITAYARNSGAEPWSADSMLLTVYNDGILDILVKDVIAGEIGGTTGGKVGGGTTSAAGDEPFAMDNHDKIVNYLDDSGYQLTFEDFTTLRTDMSLQKIISANYGAGVWGLLSDKLQWKSSDPATVSVDYKQGGFYSDIRNYSYVSYAPATDFLLVGKGDTAEGETVTVTATHAATGMSASIDVTAKTLTDQLYVFQFHPQVTTTVTYTTADENGEGIKRELTSNDKGELAVYEPYGIKSAVMATSVKDGDTYVGTLYPSEIVSGERDIASLQLYPCNNLRLRTIANAALTFLKPDGTYYSGPVTIRAGVYKNGTYCPEAQVKTVKGALSGQSGREDINATASNGKLSLWFDPAQFNAKTEEGMENGGLQPGNTVAYVIEYRFGSDYQPGYVILNAYSDLEGAARPTDSVIQLRNLKGGDNVPQITLQTFQQYYDDTPTSYTRDVIDYTENIGISNRINKAELYTDVALLGEIVRQDEDGYTTYAGDDVTSFALYTTSGKKLTGQTGGDGTEAKQIVELKDLTKDTKLYVFPFSSTAMARSLYTMTDANMKRDGITDQGSDATHSSRVMMTFTRGNLTVKNETLPFGVSNLSHQEDLGKAGGASEELGQQIKEDIKGKVDIGAVFKQINVNDMIRKGFVFLRQMSGAAGDNMLNMMILPTEDPASFRIMVFVGYNQRNENTASSGNLSVNYDLEQIYDDAQNFKKALEDMAKDDDDDDDDDSSGEGSLKFNFYGTLLLDARLGIADGDWDISFAGGNVGTNFNAGYEWSQSFMCGPVPVLISFEVGFNADLEVAFCERNQAKAMLLDAAAGVSLEAFAGLGFDLSLVAFKLGIFGEIGADVNFLYLLPDDASGTQLNIDGEVGLKMEVKVLFITYQKTFCSTDFGWTKTWGRYDDIQEAWENGEPLEIAGLTASGRAYSMRLLANGAALVEIDGGGELENRDYLELADRVWNNGAPSGRRLLMAAAPLNNALTNVQTNAYPYANPVFVDDGSMFLYISDNDNADEMQSVVSYATRNGAGYTNGGALYDIAGENVILADSDVVASGSDGKYFAAWVKQHESPEKEMHDEITYDDLGMMMNATEIYAGAYNGAQWTTQRLTENTVADMAPTVASSGDQAIVAWRSLAATEMPTEGGSQDLSAMFNAENSIHYRVYNGAEWTTAQIAYNGAAGTVNAIDSAMLSDGTAILVYTVRTDTDVTSTETFYTLIDKDGNAVTTGRLTNDSCTDTNAQVTAAGNAFVLGWYSEHDAGVTASSDEETVVAHDIRLARINANGSVDAGFPESIGGEAGSSISSDFRFSAPAGNTDINKLSIVWSEKNAEDQYELNAVRFFQAENEEDVIITSPTDIAKTESRCTVDHFDTYTDSDGKVYTLILCSDYSGIAGLDVYDTINLEEGLEVLTGDNSAAPTSGTLTVLEQEPIAHMKLGSGTFPETAIEATADTNLRELVAGLNLPVQFTVTNTGTETVSTVTVAIGSASRSFDNLALLPGQTTTLVVDYAVPETVADVAYTVTANSQGIAKGTLVLNRPNVGISGMKLLRESDKTRDIQVTLCNNSGIPLAGSGKTVKLAFYKDGNHTQRVGDEITIPDTAYVDIDGGYYTYLQTLNVSDFIGSDAQEIPDEGIRVYARAWVEGLEELYTTDNDSFLSFKGLLTKYESVMTMDTFLEENNGQYTVNATIRNNSLQTADLGSITADILDGKNRVLESVQLTAAALTLNGEHKQSLASQPLTLAGTPASVALRSSTMSVILDAETNGGVADIAALALTKDGTLPSLLPSATKPGYTFNGWFTKPSGGEKITAETLFGLNEEPAEGEDAENTIMKVEPNEEGVYVIYAQFSSKAFTAPVTGNTGTVAVNTTVNGTAAMIALLTVEQIDSIVGSGSQSGTVAIDLSDLGTAVSSVTIPAETVKEIEAAVSDTTKGADSLTVKLTEGSVTFDADTLKAIAEEIKSDGLKVNLDSIGTENLNTAQQSAVEDLDVQAVLDVYMTSGGKRISDFKGGKVNVTVSHTLKDGQTGRGVVVWYVAGNGEKTEIPTICDDKTVSFTVEHFSNYVIAYDAQRAAACPKDDTCPLSAFTDLDPAKWYHDGIEYCLKNGLMYGVGDSKFDPNGTTSRAMLVTILYRLEGEPAVTAENPFDDVENGRWYTNAVIWAAENEIVKGYGGGKFGPNDSITREQLATILYRCAQSKGQGFTGAWVFRLDYPDASEISGWANEAMHWMVMHEIIRGKGGKLVPGGNASRAEAATMLQRFCENVAE